MAQQTLNDLELGLSFRTKLNDNFTELYSTTATNTADIATNASGIATNASDIATNAAAIATLDADKLEWVAAPASASSTGSPGQVAYDASFFYVCVAVDTWIRTALATW